MITRAEIKRIKESRMTDEELVKKWPYKHDHPEDYNCYLFSMGIMEPPQREGMIFWKYPWGNPGFIGKKNTGMGKASLITGVEADCRALGLKCKVLNLNEDFKCALTPSDYVIKMFWAQPDAFFTNGDFHFVRYSQRSGIWMQNRGKGVQPTVPSNGVEGCVCKEDGEPIQYTTMNSLRSPVCYFIIGE